MNQDCYGLSHWNAPEGQLINPLCSAWTYRLVRFTTQATDQIIGLNRGVTPGTHLFIIPYSSRGPFGWHTQSHISSPGWTFRHLHAACLYLLKSFGRMTRSLLHLQVYSLTRSLEAPLTVHYKSPATTIHREIVEFQITRAHPHSISVDNCGLGWTIYQVLAISLVSSSQYVDVPENRSTVVLRRE